jgi:hypothetical protein
MFQEPFYLPATNPAVVITIEATPYRTAHPMVEFSEPPPATFLDE